MFYFLPDSTNAKRFGVAVAFAATLCLGSLSGCSTAAPIPTLDQYYLNGKPSTKEAVEKIDPKTIDRMDVLSGKQATDYTHDATTKRAVLVQTK